MSVDSNAVTTRQKPVTMRGRPVLQRQRTSPTGRLASLTQRFFLRGEQQEATEYKDVILDVDDAVTPKPEFDSFDKIPRRRTGLLALTGVVLLGVVGVATWRSFHFLSRPGSSVAASSQAMVAAQPAGAPVTPVAPVPAAPPAAAPAPEIVPLPAASSAAVAPPTRAREPVAAPVVEAPVVTAPEAESAAAEAAPARTEPERTAEPRGRAKPLRGYVWSPAANSLVPAGDSPAGNAAPVEAAPSAESPATESPAAESPATRPAPFDQPRPRAADSAPIIE